MNPAVDYLEENGDTPLPDLIESLNFSRTSVIKICCRTDRVQMEVVQEGNLFYHEVKL